MGNAIADAAGCWPLLMAAVFLPLVPMATEEQGSRLMRYATAVMLGAAWLCL
jgi:hypothetical protein